MADKAQRERKRKSRRRIALLLPGYNEGLIIATTIRSAVAAGQPLRDIYVVDDGSQDNTIREARKLLPKDHILSVNHCGKARAMRQAIAYFNIPKKYIWMHVADADSAFGSRYFYAFRRRLHAKKYAVAVGFVQSMRGNWLAHYRAFSYTYGQHLFRRIQGWLGMITVFPGPVTCFRTDILGQLDFAAESLTEDFDLTLQVHRKHLGNICFVPEAVNFTQDPQTLRDFCKQTARWQRGFFQGLRKYRVGLKPHRIDISVAYQILESLTYLAQLFITVPLALIFHANSELVAMLFIGDLGIIVIMALLAAAAAGRMSILLSVPYFYPLRMLELAIFVKAFFEVIVLRRFHKKIRGWETASRRYKLDDNALQDVAE